MLRRPAVALLVLAAVSFGVACNGGSDDDDATPTSSAETPAATAEPTAGTVTPSSAIRSIDLESTEIVQALLTTTGGQYVQSSVLYIDLTEDGAEEAVVPVSSGGTQGDIAFVVLTPLEGGVESLVQVVPSESGVSVAIVGGKLTAYEPRYGPEDPLCCPAELQTTVYGWDGDALVVESTTVGPSGEQ